LFNRYVKNVDALLKCLSSNYFLKVDNLVIYWVCLLAYFSSSNFNYYWHFGFDKLGLNLNKFYYRYLSNWARSLDN